MSSFKDDKVPCARLCHIVKWDDFNGYGFNLHAQKGKNGQFIGKVDEGSPSLAAGLRQGDRIVEVNEIDIANETHNQVVERIKAFANETKLLVVDQEADDYFRENNIVIKGTMSNIKVIKTPERNPNSVEDRSEGSNCSVDENTQKSIDSNDTGHSDSTTVVQTTTDDKESNMRENGNGNMNHVHGTGNGTLGIADGANNSEPRSLNLTMSAKELREMLAQRKKYDPKKESIGFKDKFDIVQKL
ncbi:PREDICTED: Na(+)/H(+) exchange regulatory cofactor NHE-RF1 [Trachymyrmex septentrionalis]|uniref:Na(+)/H(+) exchange regulatory cofactor NHE-RF1 n=1 Tax=Trachymyrmex septentrionalis TaxID=34720 RepID=UPI00084F2FA1|nr:PREDICTED: Na(+)/H(+) exchange regulatory cofactor NHE-RF1 [Trachymyrmex septentrionalis]